ncbi:MAG: alcohol dehydrogenase catalytic domain-containing protein [Acidimicrobiales bacterium]
MKAAVYHGTRDIRLEDVPVPAPADDEILVAIAAAGICGTDVSEFAHGPSLFPIDRRHAVTGHEGPMVPGHEFAGVVAAVGSAVAGFAEGDLITSGAGVSCGHCLRCDEGRTNLCTTYSTVGLERDGGLAEFTTVPAAACANLAGRALSSDVAALAQPMSIAVHAMRRGRLREDESAVVLGAGGIGSFVVHAATSVGADVTAVDLDADRLRRAQALGAGRAVLTDRDSPVREQLDSLSPRPSVVYECTGTPSALEAAVDLVQPGGRVVVVGLQKTPIAVDLLSVALQEKELIGTLAHAFGADFNDAVDLLENETTMWAEVAPEVIPLEDLVEKGLEPMATGQPTPIKTLLDPRIGATRPFRATADPVAQRIR